MKGQLHKLLDYLLLKNKIHLNQAELKLQLLSHPSYPSLHAFTGVLDHFGVPNLALRLPVNAETLRALPPSWIAQISDGTDTALVLTERRGEKYLVLV